MTWLTIVFVFIILLGAVNLSYQVYKITELDARCRGLKHPKFWGIFSIGGNSGSGGFLLFLICRRKYPITMNEEERQIIESRKKKAGVGLAFIAVGAVFMIITIVSIQGNI